MLLQDLKPGKAFGSNASPQNDIFIEQVGVRNSVNVNVSSQDAIISIKQYGKEHEVDFNIAASRVRKNIVQTGEGHQIFDNVFAPFNEISLSLTQEGKSQHFEKYGSNSIGDKLQFKMSGNNNSMIVRNFK